MPTINFPDGSSSYIPDQKPETIAEAKAEAKVKIKTKGNYFQQRESVLKGAPDVSILKVCSCHNLLA